MITEEYTWWWCSCLVEECRNSPMVVQLRFVAEEAESCGEEGLQIGTAEDVQQRQPVLVGPVGAIHHQNIGIGALQLDLLLVGEEQVLDAVVGVSLDIKDPLRRGQII